MRRLACLLIPLLPLSSLLAANTADAQGLASCQDIHLEAQAQCELVPPGIQCETECTPISVQAACAARLQVECDGRCEASASLSCTASCQADCSARCEVDPGKFDCRASCQADCSGSCSGHCSAAKDKASCAASCEATCGASCDASCEIDAPSVDCEGRCEASCDGSCQADAELDCQIDCQAEGYAGCKVDIEGGCKTACQTERGALFCDGQYVDYGNNFEECVAALRSLIDGEIEGYAEGESRCENGRCSARGEAGASCTATPGQRGAGAALGGLSLLLAGACYARRRKPRGSKHG
jgi:hypothetical protein